jgi:hypothetical protein
VAQPYRVRKNLGAPSLRVVFTPTGSLTNFTTANHHETADATGRGTIEKAGAGPFSKNASDPTSSF